MSKTLVCVLLIGLVTVGCQKQSEKDEVAKLYDRVARIPEPALRYELYEVRNGSFVGTALLDKKTGRIWTLASTSKGGQVSDMVFSEVSIFPTPEP